MFPKLNEKPVAVDVNGTIFMIAREKIAASYAGAWAAKECLSKELSAFFSKDSIDFQNEYKKVYPNCVVAANDVGLSATVETLEYFNPCTVTRFLEEQLENKDNPFYPFFEED
jgi:hypothetical protein